MGTNDEKVKTSSRAEAGVVEEGFEPQVREDVELSKDAVDWDALDDPTRLTLPTPSTLGNPYMSKEEQTLEMEPQVMGPPGYGSPDPVTSMGRLLPLNTHPLASEYLPEGHAAAIAEDYGQSVAEHTHLPTETSHSIESAPALPTGEEAAPESYEQMTKAELLEEATSRDLDVTSANTKSEIIEALHESDQSE